jgi:hypothetical protein
MIDKKQELLNKLGWCQRFTSLETVVNLDLSNDDYIGSIIIGKIWNIARFSKKLILTCKKGTANALKVSGSEFVMNTNGEKNIEIIVVK